VLHSRLAVLDMGQMRQQRRQVRRSTNMQQQEQQQQRQWQSWIGVQMHSSCKNSKSWTLVMWL
jgi:hypothetical protein